MRRLLAYLIRFEAQHLLSVALYLARLAFPLVRALSPRPPRFRLRRFRLQPLPLRLPLLLQRLRFQRHLPLPQPS